MNRRFVLDNNIFVSALLVKNSAPFWVIKKVEEMGVILYSEATLLELNQVLNRKKFIKYFTVEEKQEFIVKLIESAELVVITKSIDVCRDPKDNKFLELAVSGDADFIISGDQDLLVLNPFRNIEIITANDFLNRFNSCYAEA
jgi:putative PIN family toxin of toxin-antitoxin system